MNNPRWRSGRVDSGGHERLAPDFWPSTNEQNGDHVGGREFPAQLRDLLFEEMLETVEHFRHALSDEQATAAQAQVARKNEVSLVLRERRTQTADPRAARLGWATR